MVKRCPTPRTANTQPRNTKLLRGAATTIAYGSHTESVSAQTTGPAFSDLFGIRSRCVTPS